MIVPREPVRTTLRFAPTRAEPDRTLIGRMVATQMVVKGGRTMKDFY